MIKWLIACSALFMGPAWGQGFALRSDHLVVEEQRHWEVWDFPLGTIDIVEGVVQPNFVRKNIDATQDILTHLRRADDSASLQDAFLAASNQRDITNLLDRGPGSETTYWEPRVGSDSRDWWFQLDLGRLISADRIVLQFADEEIGDPFLQFVVLTSDGGESIKGVLGFKQAFRTQKNNKTQRVFEIDLEPAGADLDNVFTGDMIRYVQVLITESDTTRAAQITAERYAELPASEQGAIDYYKKVTNGEVRISKATWDAIDPALQALPRHYRRELPRLAGIEVWSTGENIALGMRERKGIALDYLGKSIFGLVDGDFNSLQNISAAVLPRTVFFDLNSVFWIDTFLTFYQESFQGRALVFSNFEVQTSDGTLAPDGTLAWTTQDSKLRASQSGDAYDVSLFAEPVRTRFLQLVYWDATKGRYAIPREFQFFGEGFQPEVELVSPGAISLGGSRNLVSIEWEAATPPGTFIEIQTRTGDLLSEEYHYFNKGGAEVADSAAHEKLGFFNKGRIDTVLVAGADWSGWSAPYKTSGAAITSPSPRSFLMMRARMVTEDPQVGASLNSLRLNFVTPLATRILGEISPTIVEQLGAETPLSLFIKPIGQSRSFDDILVRAPVGMALTFDQVRIGRENQWENGDIEALAPEALQIVPTSTDSLWLRLNEPVTQNSANLIEVQFTSALYTPGGAFQASLGNSETENSWQRVDAEDATELQPGQGLILLGNVSDQRVLNAVETRPPIITPNGDRINDEMTLAFTVSNLSGQQQVDVRIFDLAGRMVRQIVEERPQVSGQYEMLWSGDGQDGHLLPPGIYLLRVEVNTDASSQVSNVVAQRVIQVVY